jgi:putative ABC transport system permease protein
VLRPGEWLRRVRYLVTRRRVEAALREEMEAHRELMGSPRQFGNLLRLREEARDVWGWRWLDDLARDLQIGVRALRRTPGYAFTALVSLAAGVALAAATVSVINAYLVRSLPYPEPDRQYHVMYAPPGPWEPAGLSQLDWTALDDIVEHAITSTSETFHAIDGRAGDPYRGLYVAPGFVAGLGVRADVGRGFTRGDFDGSEPVVMIGTRLWRERFGADPNVIGRRFTAELDGEQRARRAFRVIGVLPDGFWFGRDSRDLVDVLLPLRTRARTYRVRLREGVPVDAARQRLTEIVRSIATDLPADWPGVTLEAAHERYVAGTRPVLLAFGGAAALALAIAVANVGVLTLLRAVRRQKEIGVRLALGAGRARIARMILAEASLLAAAATGAGLALAYVALHRLGPAIATQLGRPAPGGEGALQIDAAAVLAAAGAGAVMAGVLSLAALVAPWNARLADVLRRDHRTSTDSAAVRQGRRVLVTMEIAGTLALFVTSGLMIQSLAAMIRTDFGIRTDGLVRIGVALSQGVSRDPAVRASMLDAVVEHVSALAGAPAPLFDWPQFYETPRRPVETDAGPGPVEMGVVLVSGRYFPTLDIDLKQGELFGEADRLGGEPVAVVSETAAGRLWPDGSALGRRIRVADRFISGSPQMAWRTIVGVVADVRQTYDDRDLADVYLPFMQAPPTAAGAWLYLATVQPRPQWEPALRDAIAAVDPRAVVTIAVPLREEAARQWAAPRFLTVVVTAFAVFAALLALVGTYGVTAFAVRQREREAAIRLALGADAPALVRMFLFESGPVLAAGLALGLLAAAAGARLVAHQLHRIDALDLPTFAASALVIASASLAATWWPARRAAHKRPAVMLAEE